MDYVGVAYCALTVAAVLVWHPLDCPNRSGQWSPNAIADAMRLLQHGTDLNFTINPLALHQGFHIFKKNIRSYGHELISMRSRDVGMILPFMDLTEVLHGWDIKFTVQKRTSSVLSVLLDEIYGIARKIMWSNYEEELQFKSLVEIGAFLWQQLLPVRRAAPREEEIVPQTVHKRRKTSGELSSRQLSNCGKVILNMVSNSICVNNEDTVPYLVAAIHESRTLSSLDSVSKSIFGNSNEINETFMTNIVKDIRIIKCVSEIPNKYITFSDEEKMQVLRIYDVVLQVFESQLPDAFEGVDVSVASVTQMVLKDMTGYSELIKNTIERWSKNRGLIKEKTGRKVDKDFECAIWGQLMICEYENIKSPFGSTKKLCISPIPLHFWDAVDFDLFQSVRRHEKYSVLVKMQRFTYSTFYCILKCTAFSPNSAFGNAEFENTVSAERTLRNYAV
jgi:hypothetical protein